MGAADVIWVCRLLGNGPRNVAFLGHKLRHPARQHTQLSPTILRHNTADCRRASMINPVAQINYIFFVERGC